LIHDRRSAAIDRRPVPAGAWSSSSPHSPSASSSNGPTASGCARAAPIAAWRDGRACVAYVVAVYSCAAAGWHTSRPLRTDLALDTLMMALWRRRGQRLEGLVHRSDRGARYQATRHAKRLTETPRDPRWARSTFTAPGRRSRHRGSLYAW